MTAYEYYGVLVFSVGVSLLAAAWLDWRVRNRIVRRAVFENMDSAAANGYFAPGEQLHGATAHSIVMDLRAYAEDPRLDNAGDKSLERHVRAWLSNREGHL
jgi:hypothetical protein